MRFNFIRRIKRSLSIALSALTLLAFFCLSCHNNTTFPQGVYILPPIQSFGTLKTGQQKIFKFVIVNNTSQKIIIKDVRTSCGCLKLQLEDNKSIVEPFSELPFNLIVNIENVGKIKYQVFIQTNTVPLCCEIYGTVFTENSLDFKYHMGGFFPGQRIDTDYILPKNNAGSSIAFEPEVNNKLQIVDFSETSEKFYRFRITGVAPKQEGTFVIPVSFSAKNELWSNCQVLLSGRVVPRVKLKTKQIFAGKVDAMKDFAVDFEFFYTALEDSNGSAPSIKIESDLKTISKTIQSENNILSVHCVFSPPASKGHFNSEITITVDFFDGTTQVLKLPMFGIVQ